MSRSLAIRCIVLLLCMLPLPAVGEDVRITNGEWPPFTSEHFRFGGALTRIVSEAFALEGVSGQFGYFPWTRAYALAQKGDWDASVGWAPTPAHREDFLISDPLLQVDKALFYLRGSDFDWARLDDLKRYRLGATAGYTYGSEWDAAARSGALEVETVTSDVQNVRKLLQHRIDAFAMEVDVAEYLLRNSVPPEEAARVVRHPRLLMRTDICLLISRNIPNGQDLLDHFNRGLEKLVKQGIPQRYLDAAVIERHAYGDEADPHFGGMPER